MANAVLGNAMTIREDMLEAMRKALPALGSQTESLAKFLQSRLSLHEGFLNRGGQSDLYYTVFGLESLMVLGRVIPQDNIAKYLLSFGSGDNLNLIRLCSLARCWADMENRKMLPDDVRSAMVDRLNTYRTEDGGFATHPGRKRATAFANFFAAGALDDLEAEIPEPDKLILATQALQKDDGSFINDPDVGVATTPSTAVAAILLSRLNQPAGEKTADWFWKRLDDNGGFRASGIVPICDLVSTAVALHAMSKLGHHLQGRQAESCRNFIFTMRTLEGAFHDNLGNPTPDSEYVFYALLSLGHLA